MIALDTNILVHARREEMPFHAPARALVADLVLGDAPWAIPWPCVYEFIRVVTHARVFRPPTPLDLAMDELERLFDAPSLTLLGDGPLHRVHWRRAVREGRATGPLVYDAHIAALLAEHGVGEFWTLDRDFSRFAWVKTRDPFLKSS